MKIIHKLLIIAGFLSLLLLAVAGPLYRLQWLELGSAFLVLRWAAYVGIGAGILLIVYLIWRRPKGTAGALTVLALVASVAAVGIPYLQLQTARSVPPIHDISTDTVNPPEFVAVAPLRTDAPNPVAYAGEETAAQQREAYPDIVTYVSAQSAEQLFEKSLQVVEEMGWQLVASDQATGRIEATDTTTWFGFKDDVVIRIRAQANGAKLDIRSKSRVGRSDVGKNAERIRAFITALDR